MLVRRLPGQWCVDADYVHRRAGGDGVCAACVATASGLLGDAAAQRGDGLDVSRKWYNRIISTKQAERLKKMLDEDHGGKVLMGGPAEVDVAARFIPFTIVYDPKPDSLLMTEEIFGPILVIKSVSGVDEAIGIMKRVCPTPLALYVYSQDSAYTEKILTKCTSGSVGVNTTCEQSIGPCSPFGGVGQSGMGAYHGKFGFDEFSHLRPILYRTTAIPVCFFPQQLWPVNNQFAAFVPPLVVKLFVTGLHTLIPAWARTVGKATIGALLAAAVAAAANVWVVEPLKQAM